MLLHCGYQRLDGGCADPDFAKHGFIRRRCASEKSSVQSLVPLLPSGFLLLATAPHFAYGWDPVHVPRSYQDAMLGTQFVQHLFGSLTHFITADAQTIRDLPGVLHMPVFPVHHAALILLGHVLVQLRPPRVRDLAEIGVHPEGPYVVRHQRLLLSTCCAAGQTWRIRRSLGPRTGTAGPSPWGLFAGQAWPPNLRRHQRPLRNSVGGQHWVRRYCKPGRRLLTCGKRRFTGLQQAPLTPSAPVPCRLFSTHSRHAVSNTPTPDAQP